jgi:hypothetical protein
VIKASVGLMIAAMGRISPTSKSRRWFMKYQIERRGSEIAQDIRENIADERSRPKSKAERNRNAEIWKSTNSSQSDYSE